MNLTLDPYGDDLAVLLTRLAGRGALVNVTAGIFTDVKAEVMFFDGNALALAPIDGSTTITLNPSDIDHLEVY